MNRKKLNFMDKFEVGIPDATLRQKLGICLYILGLKRNQEIDGDIYLNLGIDKEFLKKIIKTSKEQLNEKISRMERQKRNQTRN